MSETIQELPMLQLNRIVPASPERVFAAWTTPEQIKVWFGPETCRVLDAQVNLQVGGEYCLRLFTDRFGELTLSGEYREIQAPTRLVYTWHWKGAPELEGESSLVSVEFIPSGHSTEIRLRHEQLPNAQARDDHRVGWTGTFDKLEKYLAGATS
jgi:uncharacterized protein YndB with AHSA1/START domain